MGWCMWLRAVHVVKGLHGKYMGLVLLVYDYVAAAVACSLCARG